MNVETLGLIAGAFTTFASFPQIIYIVRTRSMKDISLVTLILFGVGVFLWLAYGIFIGSLPVVMWNALSLILYISQIGLKLSLTNHWRAKAPTARSRAEWST